MKLLQSGSWWLRPKLNPSWNCSGRSDSCGGFVIPKECEAKIIELEASLGEKPSDLTYEYMKD